MVQSTKGIIEAEVTQLGHSGDGVVEVDGRKYFVAYAAPGDRLQIKFNPGDKDRAAIVQILKSGDARVTAPCRHFTECGGCALQHLSDLFVADWKREQIIDALAHRGLHDVTVRPTRTMPPASRRRAAFTAEHGADGIQIGFHARMSKRLVPVSECTVLDKNIVQALPGLEKMLAPLLRHGQSARLLLTQTGTGLDVDVQFGSGQKAEPNLRLRTLLTASADRLDLARLSWNGVILLERRKPQIVMGGTPVSPPPGAFLQASSQGEAALIALVLEALGTKTLGAKGARILDLFAGCGTFTFPVASHARVHAVEGDRAMTEAIRQAANQRQGLKQIEASHRDLQRGPLSIEELKPYAAVIFDPPKAGTRAQADQIAASQTHKVIAVSCAPATFARDARSLVDGGFLLRWVTPVDQFRWSAEVELVALFERA
ncbi:MAG: class I SAM-dependent RNA methyltransferase [Pseudomonadota bacterium]